MIASQRTLVAAVAALCYLLSSHTVSADDTKKPSTKTESTKSSSQSNNRVLKQAETIKAQNPAGPGNMNSMRPNQNMKSGASQGWDTKATDKGSVKAGSGKTADPRVIAKQENEKLKQEQLRTAQRYPATGKAPPSPSTPSTKPAESGTKNFFNRLLGKTK